MNDALTERNSYHEPDGSLTEETASMQRRHIFGMSYV